MAELIDQRIGEIESADSVETLIKYRIGRCHQLTGNRKNQYAMGLTHPYRLVFEKKKDKIIAVRFATLGGKYPWRDFHPQELCHARHTKQDPIFRSSPLVVGNKRFF